MGRKKSDNYGSASLFDVPDWEAKKQEFSQYMHVIDDGVFAKAWNAIRGDGAIIMPALSLVPRILAYSAQVMTAVEATLCKFMVDKKDVQVIMDDYGSVLWGGGQVIKANPEQMKMAMAAIPPALAYTIDRWGLYSCLFQQYALCLKVLTDYSEKVIGEGATQRTREEFWNATPELLTGTANAWLIRARILKLQSTSQEEMEMICGFLNATNTTCSVNAYMSLYYICKFAYNATEAELEEITMPTGLAIDTNKLRFVAEQYAESSYKTIIEEGDNFAGLLTGSKRKKSTINAARNWRDNIKGKVHIPINILAILTRTINTSIVDDTEYVQSITQSIKRFYDKEIDGIKVNERFLPQRRGGEDDGRNDGGITELSIQTTIAGVNMLPAYVPGTKGDGSISYRISISRFAELCGYADANNALKMSLLGSLFLLNNLYVISRRPERYERNKETGKVKRSGGIKFIKILTVQEIEPESGNLLINVMDEAIRGAYIVVEGDKMMSLISIAKSLPQSRFNYQLLHKTNINASDLIDQIFGYDQRRRDALDEKDMTLLKTIERDAKAHKTRNLQKVLKWFNEYQNRGIVSTYSYDEKKGVFRWTRKDVMQIEKDVLKPGELLPGTGEIQRVIEE